MGEKKKSGSRSTWDNLFSQQRRGLCTRNRQAVQQGGTCHSWVNPRTVERSRRRGKAANV